MVTENAPNLRTHLHLWVRNHVHPLPVANSRASKGQIELDGTPLCVVAVRYSCFMIAILLITHAPVGAALLQAAKHVYGAELQRCEAIDVIADAPMASILEQAKTQIAALDDGHGVLVFSDLYGASPCNMAATLPVPGKVEVISGVSLPLLVRALNYRNLPLTELSERIISGAAQLVLRVAGRAPQNQWVKTAEGSAQQRFASQQQ
jgi:PTS system ascorbate-specific IIA component